VLPKQKVEHSLSVLTSHESEYSTWFGSIRKPLTYHTYHLYSRVCSTIACHRKHDSTTGRMASRSTVGDPIEDALPRLTGPLTQRPTQNSRKAACVSSIDRKDFRQPLKLCMRMRLSVQSSLDRRRIPAIPATSGGLLMERQSHVFICPSGQFTLT